jgi:hypothetical protein
VFSSLAQAALASQPLHALSEVASLPHVELDDLFWGPNWAAKPLEEFRSLVSAACATDRWVVDGNYSDGVLPADLHEMTRKSR